MAATKRPKPGTTHPQPALPGCATVTPVSAPKPKRQSKPPPVELSRCCRWLTFDVAASLRFCGHATLRIIVTWSDGKVVDQTYHLRRREGGKPGWLLRRYNAGRDGERPEYEIDTSRPGEPAEAWRCSCGDWKYRHSGRDVPLCKHGLAMIAAFAAIGLDPQTGEPQCESS